MKTLTPHPKKFTRDIYHKMAESAIFQESDRCVKYRDKLVP
jgi:hypothetical protein